jgi:hypothetical protein
MVITEKKTFLKELYVGQQFSKWAVPPFWGPVRLPRIALRGMR